VIFVYLCEAHAADTWPLSPTAPPSHKSVAERAAVGLAFLERWPAFAELLHSWYVDDIGDEATIRLGLWPERYVYLQHGRAVWASTFKEDPNLCDELRAAAETVFKQ